MKNEKLIIVGGSGSGKNYLMEHVTLKGLKPLIKCTTRPIRKGEKQGVDYHFMTTEEFFKNIESGEFLTYQSFNVTPNGKDHDTWYYGILKKDFMESQAMIMTPGEVKDIKEKYNDKDLFIVYLDIDEDIRRSRINKREDLNDSVNRRLESDREDFKDFKLFDLQIRHHDFILEDIWDLMS